MHTLPSSSLKLDFILEQYGYRLEKVLNNENRWGTKLVCLISDKDSNRCVSTTCATKESYLELAKTLILLKKKEQFSPRVIKLFPQNKTIVCNYIGESLSHYILENPDTITDSFIAISHYLKELNSIKRSHKRLIIPSIINDVLEISEVLDLLPKIKAILPVLINSKIYFVYGCGIEDPHIWNLRVVNCADELQAFTADFDYFSQNLNYSWELGYLYATFRWFRQVSYFMNYNLENLFISLIENSDPKSNFMFWLGVLSSYCGYKESLLLRINHDFQISEHRKIIRNLDNKIFYLAKRLLERNQD